MSAVGVKSRRHRRGV